ncbi:MAG: hypothetical protein R3Y63_09070 [Eubacteriales bacterium]
MNFIEMLYWRRLSPWEKRRLEGSDYDRLAKEIVGDERKLCEALSDMADSEEMLSVFAHLMETRSELTALVDRERFAEGFRLGVMCMVDSLVDLGDGE